MKISIWRQFSSNHSASFTVVGTFPTPEKAKEAGDELQAILDEIQAWWDALTPEQRMEADKKSETEELTPPEIRLRDKYSVSWTHSLNWFHWHWYENAKPIIIVDRHIFVHPPCQTWCGPEPFDQLIQKLGGTVAVDIGESRTHKPEQLFLDVTCTLPDNPEDAILLYESFREDFEAYHKDFRLADEKYSPNLELELGYESLHYKFADPDIRIFEVEKTGNKLRLYGIDFYANWSWDKDFFDFLNYLHQEGCTDIQFTFWSTQIIRYHNEDET